MERFNLLLFVKPGAKNTREVCVLDLVELHGKIYLYTHEGKETSKRIAFTRRLFETVSEAEEELVIQAQMRVFVGYRLARPRESFDIPGLRLVKQPTRQSAKNAIEVTYRKLTL